MKLEVPSTKTKNEYWLTGEVLSVIYKKNWFAFIKTEACDDNVYFDQRSYKGQERDLIPGKKIRFLMESKDKDGDKLYFATKVEII